MILLALLNTSGLFFKCGRCQNVHLATYQLFIIFPREKSSRMQKDSM
jgi:hypothetical protein